MVCFDESVRSSDVMICIIVENSEFFMPIPEDSKLQYDSRERS